VRRALTVGTVLAAFALSPGQATAATIYTPTNAVHPVLECVSRAADGSWTAVIGYTNTSVTKTIPLGSWNSITPTRYDGRQPTLYKSGTQHGALSLKIAAYDYTYGSTSWMLDGNMLFIGATFDAGVPTCTIVQMPAQGNDAGAALVLVVAGIVGALVVVRVRRRTLAAVSTSTSDPVRMEHVGA
jgi:hypothetical protein